MAVALNAIVLGVSGIALLPLLSKFIIDPIPPDQITTVRVIFGEGVDNPNEGMGGNVPGIALWDRFGRSIGTSLPTGEKLQEANFHDIQIVADAGVGNVPAEYISISHGGNDAICIAGITVSFPSGDKAAWTGDVAAICNHTTGAIVSASALPIAQTQQQGDQTVSQTPYCVWIDGDGTGGIPHQGIGIHLPDFGNAVTSAQADAYLQNPDLMCKSGPRYRMYPKLRAENPILTFKPPPKYDGVGVDVDPKKIIKNPGVLAEQDVFALRDACIENNQLAGCSSVALTLPVPFKRSSPRTSACRERPRSKPLPLSSEPQISKTTVDASPSFRLTATSTASTRISGDLASHTLERCP